MGLLKKISNRYKVTIFKFAQTTPDLAPADWTLILQKRSQSVQKVDTFCDIQVLECRGQVWSALKKRNLTCFQFTYFRFSAFLTSTMMAQFHKVNWDESSRICFICSTKKTIQTKIVRKFWPQTHLKKWMQIQMEESQKKNLSKLASIKKPFPKCWRSKSLMYSYDRNKNWYFNQCVKYQTQHFFAPKVSPTYFFFSCSYAYVRKLYWNSWCAIQRIYCIACCNSSHFSLQLYFWPSRSSQVHSGTSSIFESHFIL